MDQVIHFLVAWYFSFINHNYFKNPKMLNSTLNVLDIIFKLLTHASLHFIFPFIAPRKVKLLCVNFIIFFTLLPKVHSSHLAKS